MAINKIVNFKGAEASYWKILNSVYNAIPNTTAVILGLYISKDARDADVNNFLERMKFEFAGELSRDEAYVEITASKMVKKIITEASEGVEEVSEMVESNEFAGAEAI